MLASLFGSENAERVLIFLLLREEGYAAEIVRFFNVSLSMIQKQLKKFELAGVLIKKDIGKNKLYSFNPRYAFLSELKALLEKAYEFYPPEQKEALEYNRRRP